MSVPFRLNEIVCKSTTWFRREVFKPVFTCPAAWCFAAIWAVAAIYLVTIDRGYIIVLSCLFLLAILMFFCVITVGSWVFQLAFGYLSFSVLARRWLSHLLINGFGEEFLFRGALQTRLRALLSPSWAIVIQALLFGIWHFGKNFNNLRSAGINITTAAIAFSVIRSAAFGLAYGIIFQRTRNLLACSVIHVVANSLRG